MHRGDDWAGGARGNGLGGLEAEAQVQEDGNSRDGGSGGNSTAASDRKSPKVISPSDPSSAWTAKAALRESPEPGDRRP